MFDSLAHPLENAWTLMDFILVVVADVALEEVKNVERECFRLSKDQGKIRLGGHLTVLNYIFAVSCFS